MRSPRRGMCAAVLTLESITLGLTTPVMVTIADVSVGIAMTIGLLPMLPAVRLAQSAYLGYDLFDGISNAEAATGVDLWLAAGPSLLILVAWMVLLTLLLRIFQWDPRVNK